MRKQLEQKKKKKKVLTWSLIQKLSIIQLHARYLSIRIPIRRDNYTNVGIYIVIYLPSFNVINVLCIHPVRARFTDGFFSRGGGGWVVVVGGPILEMRKSQNSVYNFN